jgi:hypothetical protein
MGAAVVRVSVEWRCRRTTVELNWSAERGVDVDTGLLHVYRMEAESWIFQDPMQGHRWSIFRSPLWIA